MVYERRRSAMCILGARRFDQSNVHGSQDRYRKTSLKADREDLGGVRQTAPVNSDTNETHEPPIINIHQNSFRNLQGSSRISHNQFATKSNTQTKRHSGGTHPDDYSKSRAPSNRIAHARPIKISRFGHTPQPPTNLMVPCGSDMTRYDGGGRGETIVPCVSSLHVPMNRERMLQSNLTNTTNLY